MQTPDESSDYRQSDLPVEERVADLLGRMTLSEKVGQLAGTFVGQMEESVVHDVDTVADWIREDGIGAVSPFGTGAALYDQARTAAETANRLQQVAVEETRLGIPLLMAVDGVHGHAYIKEATVFPNNLGAAATWDPDLVREGAAVTAREIRATGAHHNYSPTCDVARDPRWGRTAETFGESPHLVGRMAAAKVRGYGDADRDVLSTAKHFPAYGDPERGEDTAPVDVSEYTLRSVFLPPFEAALAAGADTVMPCYNVVDGVPAHASSRLLTDVLRGELDFEGLVASDWDGVGMLHRDHRTATSARDGARQTHVAGLDLASIGGVDHAERLVDLVESGDLSEDRVDESVRRVLAAKFRLGLFEDPYTDPGEAVDVVGAPDHEAVARRTAEKSLTLLRNDDDLLPLSDVDDLLVAGPNADSLPHQFGGWSAYETEGTTGVTIRAGLADALGADAVAHERGATTTERDDVAAAAAAAREADAAVVALGENWYIHEFGPEHQSGTGTGEFPTRGSLGLPAAQRELVAAIEETGTPTVAVLVTGRPLIVDQLAETVPAILMAYYPGSMGGRAVADVLLGEAEPGGRLPISMPRSMGDLPTRYNYLRHPAPIGEDEHPDSYDPLFPFGHGLSYTEFEYRTLTLSDEQVGPADTVTARVTLANVGDRTGEEVVQAYVRDRVSSRVVPDRQLKGFQRVELSPGTETTVEVPIDVADLGVVQADGERRPEAGAFDVVVDDLSASFVLDDE